MPKIESSASSAPTSLKRTLSTGFALAVTVGGIIGLGILRTPGEIAEVVPDPVIFVLLWMLGGLFVLLSAVVVAELVAMTPRSGGCYALVRRAYGPFPGFVIGWVDWLSFVGDISLKAVVVTEFAALLLPAIAAWQTPLAIMVSTVFAALQLRGVALGARIQQVAAACMALIVLGFTLALVFSEPTASGDSARNLQTIGGLGAWSLVAASIIYTYDGWLNAAYFSGEVKGGTEAVVRACIKGVVAVIIIYVLLITVLAWKVPLDSLVGSDLALATALELAISPAAAAIVLVASILILLAHQNLLYLATPRILHALAVDGLATRRAGKVSRGGNPVFAVLLSWVLSVGLILIGGFRFLLHLSVFFYVFLYIALIAGVLILRYRQPDQERPYRIWGHPYSTMACLGGWVVLTVFQAVAEAETAVYALVMVAVSWPVYKALVRTRSK